MINCRTAMTSAVVFAIWLSFQQPLLLLLLLLHAQAGSMLFKADKLNPNSICDQYPSLCRTQLVQGQPWMGGVERHQQQQSASLPATSDRIMVRALQPAFGIGKNKLRSMLKTPFNVPLDEQMGPAVPFPASFPMLLQSMANMPLPMNPLAGQPIGLPMPAHFPMLIPTARPQLPLSLPFGMPTMPPISAPIGPPMRPPIIPAEMIPIQAAISPTKPISVALPRTTSLDYMMMQLYLSSKLENERRRRERYFAKKFCKECF
ncbi:Protein translocase subunit SecA [Trichinella pseudospiralis]